MTYERSTGPGWDSLVDPIVKMCEDAGIEIYQIKEKFGTLRIYINSVYHTPEERAVLEPIEQAMAAAENRSSTICEVCGAPGVHARHRGWFKTTCPAHAIPEVGEEPPPPSPSDFSC